MSEDSFAFRLKELLEYKKLTLQAVGDGLGVSRTAVHKWTRGGEIDYDNLRKLSALLEVNWIWLRYGEQAQHDAQTATPQALPMTDVRRRHTAQIMESEARMKLAQENARIVTWEWNLLTDEVTYSSNVEQVYGWPVKRNEDFWSHIPPDEVAALQAVFNRSIDSGQPCDTDFRLLTPTGEARWISSRATPLLDDAGRALKMIGISMDTTARKVAEEAVRQSEDRLRAIFELANDAMAFVDLQGNWQMVNQAFIRLSGYDGDELASVGLHRLLEVEGRGVLDAILAAPHDVYQHTVVLRHKDATARPVLLKARLHRDLETGLPEQIVLVMVST
ncbi:PAS domain S-box-containing protein [Pseudomonas sp. ok272]|uniref:PAS domain S-box protein n=1 Tax=unclassified Pseudomonas TaxID=196821 RepID=UPI0008C4387A|nr:MULTISPECIES: PAS domain S-box protein [unclassified Pseudomonas]SEN52311.1 PAS domain S-box-containing protein [Pseudomonas sp. ok272]SFN33061.1 PAS domain S-box-containing protein [Pseudomonas sp. ok602]